MKRIFRATNVIPCDLLRSMLDAYGIMSALKNEGGSAVTGNALPVPSGAELPWAWPEVWVNEEDFEMASQIAAEFQRGHETPPDDEAQPGTCTGRRDELQSNSGLSCPPRQ